MKNLTEIIFKVWDVEYLEEQCEITLKLEHNGCVYSGVKRDVIGDPGEVRGFESAEEIRILRGDFLEISELDEILIIQDYTILCD